MRRTKLISPSYLGAAVAIATGLATSLASPPQARAQDLNLQTQVNIFSPPITAVLPAAPAPSAESFLTTDALLTALKSGRCRSPDRSLIKRLEQKPAQNLKELTDPDAVNIAAANNKQRRAQKLAAFPINVDCPTMPQPTMIKTTFTFNPTYETNVLKKGDNSSNGVSSGLGSNFLFTTAGLPSRMFDLIAVSAGETSVRYASPFSSSSFDAITSQLFYQAFLHGDGYNRGGERIADIENYKGALDSGLITFTTIGFGVQNQAVFVPTFHNEKADLFTPQVTLSRQNINLDDASDVAGCYKQAHGFCHYANLSLTVGQTFSDMSAQENFNVAGSGALGWKITPELGIALNATATGKHYEHFVGGREDLLLQAGPALTYSHTNNDMTVSFQLPVTYFKNYSTVSAAAWSGLIIQPTFSIAFATQVGPTPPK